MNLPQPAAGPGLPYRGGERKTRATTGAGLAPRNDSAIPLDGDSVGDCSATPAYDGACLCRSLRVSYRTRRPVAEWPLRTCGCQFCRRHAAVYTFDASGAAGFVALSPAIVRPFRIGQRNIDFLVCARCDTVALAVTHTELGARAIVNVQALSGIRVDASIATPLAHDATTSLNARLRTQLLWTPLVAECAPAPACHAASRTPGGGAGPPGL